MPTGVEVTIETFETKVSLKLVTMDGSDKALTIGLEKTPSGATVEVSTPEGVYCVTLPTGEDIEAFVRAAITVFIPGKHLHLSGQR